MIEIRASQAERSARFHEKRTALGEFGLTLGAARVPHDPEDGQLRRPAELLLEFFLFLLGQVRRDKMRAVRALPVGIPAWGESQLPRRAAGAGSVGYLARLQATLTRPLLQDLHRAGDFIRTALNHFFQAS